MRARLALIVMISLIGLVWVGMPPGDKPSAPAEATPILAPGTASSLDSAQPVPPAPYHCPGDGAEMGWEHYTGVQPQQWGEKVTGVAFALDTPARVVALTFDLCGGAADANGWDKDLVDFLEEGQIPATFFVAGPWIEANPEHFRHLNANPLFEIGNHGARHLPLSTTGRMAYGIKGTASLAAAMDEVEVNSCRIEALTGQKPHFYRSGTNYYDEVAVAVAREMGYASVGYNLLGDAGATFSSQQVKCSLLQVQPGAIVLLHANRPESGTAEGVMEAVPLLLAQGYRMVKLSEYNLRVY